MSAVKRVSAGLKGNSHDADEGRQHPHGRGASLDVRNAKLGGGSGQKSADGG